MSEFAGLPSQKGVALVVEDDEHMRALLASMLRDFGCRRAIEVASVEAALGALSSQAVSLALIDLRLADEDGLALIGAIRAHPVSRIRTTPVIAVSRTATAARVQAALSVGANGFIAKPLSTATFQRQVSLALARGSVMARPRVVSHDAQTSVFDLD